MAAAVVEHWDWVREKRAEANSRHHHRHRNP
jgi:hypothetical protein